MIKDDNFVELKSYKVISVNELVIAISNMTNRNINNIYFHATDRGRTVLLPHTTKL